MICQFILRHILRHLQNTCPVVLIHGEKDSMVERVHFERFYHRMEELARECELHMLEDTSHAFLLAEYTSNLVACKIGIHIIDCWFENQQKG